MSLEQWQIALRKQFARKQNFRLTNVGDGAGLLGIHGGQSADRRRVSRGHPRDRGWATTTAPARISPSTRWGPANTSNGSSASCNAGPAARGPWHAGFTRSTRRCICATGPSGRSSSGPASSVRPGCASSPRDYFDGSGVLRADAYGRFDVFLKQAGAFAHDLRCYDDALDFIAEVRDRAALLERIDKTFPAGIESAAFADLLKVPLYPYQREGALFAARAGRSLIADDMGLGKTIQAIAACEILARTAGIERVLIVCPTSLKHQWKQEIEKFCARAALVVEGLPAKRADLYAAESFYKITNYEVVHRDLEAIHQWGPEVIILDEAQRIKNWKTRRAQTIKRLNSKYAIVLTGTPLENRLEELHSIVEFVDRFRLGPVFRFLAEHQHVDEDGRVIGYRNLDRIGRTLEPILIRRTKKEVLKELPERLDKNYFVPMTKEQMAHHAENAEIVARIVAKWRRFRIPLRGRPAAADDRPAEHAHELQQHLSARSRRPISASRRTSCCPSCGSSSSSRATRPSCSANGCGPTS